jgi:hypothetical protein
MKETRNAYRVLIGNPNGGLTRVWRLWTRHWTFLSLPPFPKCRKLIDQQRNYTFSRRTRMYGVSRLLSIEIVIVAKNSFSCEADHSPKSSAEVKNGRAIPPLPHMSSWHSA